MRYLFFSFFLFQIQSCSKGKNSDYKEIKKENAEQSKNIVVTNISKTCYKNLDTNVYDYMLCIKWSLTEDNIKSIISLGQKDGSPEILHSLTPVIPSWIFADIIIENEPYKIEINPISFYYLIDNKGNRVLYTFNNKNQKNIEKLFIRKLSEADDDKYDKKVSEVKKDLRNQENNISNWEDKFTFDNNNYEQLYKEYTVEIENEGVFFYEGKMPGCKIFCTYYIVDNVIYLYYDGEKTSCSNYDTGLIDKLQDGDLLFKIFIKNGQKYIESPIINYWDDTALAFKKNVQIKIN